MMQEVQVDKVLLMVLVQVEQVLVFQLHLVQMDNLVDHLDIMQEAVVEEQMYVHQLQAEQVD
tara:strand:+ start:314 stop:499 length:186 start_codon:yes stop_codon:yes gene_type:complete